MKKVLVINGSTASKKSETAISLAKKYNGEIISCDSVQVYRGLDIGSAKIQPEDMEGIPHHLIDIFDLDEKMDVALFQQLAREKIEEIIQRGKLPILVGGTGLYIKAVINDYTFEDEEEFETKDYSDMTNQELYDRLVEKDPEQAEKIHLNNRQRLIRINQLMDTTNKTRTEIISQQDDEYIYDVKLFYLMTQRDKLVERIDKRVDNMFEEGLLEEVNTITNHGQNWDYQGLRAIGYKEFKRYYTREQMLDEVKEQIKIHTRQFSKRQLTWFKHQFIGEIIDVLQDNYYEILTKEIDQWISSQE
ncbi:MAG: tRNA (adenosine(37)-N6)-dimethylallyltransferase MiaA [Erysipelothrix sp.]|nr:tRNA (adenosine(37)-N6)-dimethylallyltransferase MiaA [Erysipelothrix sp.]